jgi:branched-chain amino acid transport system permease protein
MNATMRRAAVYLLIAGVLVAVPFVLTTGPLFLATSIVIAILFATSTNLLFGRAGIPSFGQAAFYGAGAYTVALASQADWQLPLALIAAVAVASLLAGIAALITYRLTGLAFSMITLAFSQVAYLVVIKSQTLGGYDGIPGVFGPKIGPFNPANKTTLWFIIVIVAVVALFVFRRIWYSPFGYTLLAIKSDPVRASYLGVSVRTYRAVAFIIAGGGAGLAGGLTAYASKIVTSDSLAWTESAVPIIMLLLGGAAYFWGPAVGAILLSLALYYFNQVSNLYLLFVGILLLIVLIALPRGLLSLTERFGVQERAVRSRELTHD